MKKTLFIVFYILLFFVGCSTIKIEEEISTFDSSKNDSIGHESNTDIIVTSKNDTRKIYYHDTENEMFLHVYGVYDDTTNSLYPITNEAERETAQLAEITFSVVPNYYVFFPDLNKAIIYRQDSNSKSDAPSLKKGETIPVKSLRGKIKYDDDKKESALLVDLNQQFIPQNPDSEGIIGTWISVDSSTPQSITFLDNGELRLDKSEYCEYYSLYNFINENIISVQIVTVSLITGNQLYRIDLYYYENDILYKFIFPLKDVTEDVEIIHAIDGFSTEDFHIDMDKSVLWTSLN
ncbi:MAG: hypothetical protein KBT02_10090 [Treponema sp.]|nr:hypothetical protein [Candidatus Treponema caballi]